MKTVIIIALFMAVNAYAAGQEVLKLKRGVVFNHKSHQANLCSACHVETEGTPGKIPNLGKEWAHNTCIECHDIFEKGPTKCDGCHKK